MKTHQFDYTGQAYDACQCDDNIEKGDILVCLRDQVVGFADTWPVAVTDFPGHFHQAVNLENYCKEEGWDLEAAKRVVAALGFTPRMKAIAYYGMYRVVSVGAPQERDDIHVQFLDREASEWRSVRTFHSISDDYAISNAKEWAEKANADWRAKKAKEKMEM